MANNLRKGFRSTGFWADIMFQIAPMRSCSPSTLLTRLALQASNSHLQAHDVHAAGLLVNLCLTIVLWTV